MATEEIKRVRYYERQYLGVQDFQDEQEYHRDLMRRHVLGEHTWGIVVGLELLEQDKDGGAPGVDVFITPGMAIDGFGHQIELLEPVQLPEGLFASFLFNKNNPQGQWVPVWIRYCEEMTSPPPPGYGQCDIQNQESRTVETFELVVGNLTPSQQRDQISVNGILEDATNEFNDASIPYQALVGTDPERWLIQLGYVRWLAKASPTADGDHFVKSQTDDDKKKAHSDRSYAGNISAAMLAPAGELKIADRTMDPLDATMPGVAVTLEGSLEVDRLLDAKANVEIDGGQLIFDDAGASDGGIPLYMQRQTGSGGLTTDLRIHIGDQAGTNGATTRLSIGPKNGSDEQAVLAVKADDTVDIATGTLDFKSKTRQMINLWSTNDGKHQYGIGVQAYTTYFRSHGEYCWFRDGVHSDTQSDPGASGTLQLKLDDQARLFMGAQTRQMLNLWNANYGIGVQNNTLYFRSDNDFCWFRGGTHSDSRDEPGGGALAMKLDDSSTLTVSGGINSTGDVVLNGGKLDLREPGGGTDTDVMLVMRHHNSPDHNDMRLVIGDNIGGDDRLVVGPIYFGDGQFKEQFSVANNGDTTVAGRLTVQGSNNLVRAFTATIAVTNAGTDNPASWSVNYSAQGYVEVYTVFAVLQGFSIWGNGGNTAFNVWSHSADVNAIPQHVFVIVDGHDLNGAHGRAYCSESLASNEGDNTILLTVVALGRSAS